MECGWILIKIQTAILSETERARALIKDKTHYPGEA
jgi:hypothetical protein